MVAAVGAKASQLRSRSILAGGAGFTDVSQTRVRSVYNFPSVEGRVTQSRIRSVAGSGPDVQASQLRVRTIVRGKIADPSIRVWECTLDAHDYYFLRLGDAQTLVYDTHAEQWYVWGTESSNLWSAYTGCNWGDGDAIAASYGSNVVTGDDRNGALYFLDPDSDVDDHFIEGPDVTVPFIRVAQGQMLVEDYSGIPCYSVLLSGSIGDLSVTDLVGITLDYSDDRGNTYVTAGTVNVDNGDYSARANWRSLGNMTIPGRLFRITDYGSLRRIDSLDLEDGE